MREISVTSLLGSGLPDAGNVASCRPSAYVLLRVLCERVDVADGILAA